MVTAVGTAAALGEQGPDREGTQWRLQGSVTLQGPTCEAHCVHKSTRYTSGSAGSAPTLSGVFPAEGPSAPSGSAVLPEHLTRIIDQELGVVF